MKMETEQTNANEAIVQAVVEETTVAIQVMTVNGVERTQNVGPKLGRPIMRQLTFNWSFTDKYAELRNFKLEVENMFQNYSISKAERVPIMINWLGRQDLQILEFLIQQSKKYVIQKVSLKHSATNSNHSIIRSSGHVNYTS